VSLPAHQQSLLNGMDRALAARDPRLAAMFAIFTQLTRGDGPPPTERLEPGPSLPDRLLDTGMARAKAPATIPIVLVAGLMAAIIALGVATSSGTVCPAATARQDGQISASACESSAHALNK
jgi:hypothetical protein